MSEAVGKLSSTNQDERNYDGDKKKKVVGGAIFKETNPTGIPSVRGISYAISRGHDEEGSEASGVDSTANQLVDEVLDSVPKENSFQYNFKPCDRYGFYREGDEEVDISIYKSKVEKENERLKKWIDMLNRWKYFNERKKKKLKKRVRKGIPDAVRGKVWMEISRASELLELNEGVYEKLVATQSPYVDSIKKDIARTFPSHDFFSTEDGRATLFRVLKAYAVHDEEIGYCQGMGFIAALFLTYVEEESAFWLFVRIMKHFDLRDNFKNGMQGLQLRFFQFNFLLRKFNPRLFRLFESLKVHPSLYSTGWFLTHFLYNDVPFEYTLRIWDMFLLEGVKVIFRVSIMIMLHMSNDLLHCDPDEVLQKLCRVKFDEIFSDRFFRDSFRLKFRRKVLKRYRVTYEKRESER